MPSRVFSKSALCVAVAVFLLNSSLFGQATFEVRHLASSPGGVGTADGFGAAARFQYPAAIWGDGTYLYVGDQSGHAIRRVTIATGETRFVAGSVSSGGYADGPAELARFDYVRGVWGDGDYLYIAERGNNSRIRRMSLATGQVGTIAGTAQKTPADGPASQASFRCPLDIWGDGRFLYVADSGDFPIHQAPNPGAIRRIDLVTYAVTTIVTISFINPTRLTGDGKELFIAARASIRAMDLGTGSIRDAATLSTRLEPECRIDGILFATGGIAALGRSIITRMSGCHRLL